MLILISSLVLFAFKAKPFSSNKLNALGKVIVVDPGHGGQDVGAVGFNGSYEKDINLEISKKLIKGLESRGYNVISTRESDEYVDNLERARLANRNSPHLFLSIHCNSMENNISIHGAQVLHYPDRLASPNNQTNSFLAQTMLDSIVNNTGANDKGIVERKDLIVLNQTNMQALVIECGFLSNRNEEKLLSKERYQNKVVDSIISGVDNYFALD